MNIQDFIKCVYCDSKSEKEQTILFAHKYDPNRIQAIQLKIQNQTWINIDQLKFDRYYITTKGGITAWIRMDPRLIKEIMRRASVAQNADFKTAVYVPPLARDRKHSIDSLMMDYKKVHKDIRYIVRNGQTDLKVLVKRISEGSRLPYREIDIKELGDISPLKPKCPVEDFKETEKDEVDEQGFSKVKVSKSPLWIQKVSERQQIFRNITSFLDGFSPREEAASSL